MKHKIGILALAFCLLLCVLPIANNAAAASTCFVSINDDLLTLDNGAYVTTQTSYVPYRVFQYFGIYGTYFTSDNILLLYNDKVQLFFDLNANDVYDGNGTHYSSTAISRSSGVYVPVNFVCGIFGGLSATYVNGNAYGDIVRITDGSQILSDRDFLSAASLMMRSYYNAYYGVTPTPIRPPVTAEPSEDPTDTPEVTESDDPTPSASPDEIDATVYLNFIGIPSDVVLGCLDTYGLRACFFVTEAEIRSNPDLLRQLAASGHKIGLYCSGDAESVYETCMPLLYECSREVAMLISASEPYESDTARFAKKNSLVFCDFDLTTDADTTSPEITDRIRNTAGPLSICFTADDNTESLVSAMCKFLQSNQVTARPTAEVR